MTVDEALSIMDRVGGDGSEWDYQRPDICDDTAPILAAEIRRLRAVAEWQSSETAPRDGSKFLAWNGTEVALAFYVNGRYLATQGETDRGARTGEITHWRPIGPGPGEAPNGR
jgi:hypothetical protein